MVEQVTQVVEMVAEKLGVAAEKVYPMLVNQAGVFGGTYHVTLWVGAVALVLLILSIVAMVIGDKRYEETLMVIGVIVFVVTGVVFLVSCLVSMFNLEQYLTALHNPDWWAIEYVTKLLT